MIVMRHASSPRELPTTEKADPGNVKLERQLDDVGRASAIAMGKALRELKIPIGQVFTSPTYRAIPRRFALRDFPIRARRKSSATAARACRTLATRKPRG